MVGEHLLWDEEGVERSFPSVPPASLKSDQVREASPFDLAALNNPLSPRGAPNFLPAGLSSAGA